ncbi:hypothetical protein QTN25_008799 [Entamoeba marina]
MSSTPLFKSLEQIKKFIPELITTNITDDDIIKTLPSEPPSINEFLQSTFPQLSFSLTNIHRYPIPIYCYSILEGSQFCLNDVFSKQIRYNSTNNDLQNLYLSYKKSTIIKKLENIAKNQPFPYKIATTSQPALVIQTNSFLLQLTIDHYEGYYNNLFFNSYRSLHPSISLLFDVIDILHRDLYKTNQHLSTMTRVMIVNFLHSYGIPNLQDIPKCSSKQHVILSKPKLCYNQNVEWSICPDCIDSKIPNTLSLKELLIEYLRYYLNFDFKNRISTSRLFYEDKPPINQEIILVVHPPFTPWVLLSTSTTSIEIQQMLFLYKTLLTTFVLNSSLDITRPYYNGIVDHNDHHLYVVVEDLPCYFQTKQIIDIINNVKLSCQLLFLIPSYISSVAKSAGVVIIKFDTEEDAAYFRWVVPIPWKKNYTDDNLFRNRPIGSLFIDMKECILIDS